jgi:hypothetical protein
MERTIVEVLEVVDTREYAEGPDGKFRPVPGSGQISDCARCGRPHEVHATVRLSTGAVEVIGTGCAAGDTFEAALRKGANSAKTLARLQAELAHARIAYERAKAVRLEVEALPLPEIMQDAKHWYMGDARCYVQPWVTAADARATLTSFWKTNRAIERGVKQDVATYGWAVEALERRVERAER